MRDMDDFLPDILVYAPECPDVLARRCLRDAATTFCERTRAWRQVDDFTVTGDQIDIVAIYPDAAIYEIERVWFRIANDPPVTPPAIDKGQFTELEPVAYEEYPWFADADAEGSPRYYTQTTWNTLQVLPRSAGVLKISAFLKPTPGALMLADVLWEQFHQAMTDGALARIMALPGQAFTNPAMATAFNGAFAEALDRNFQANIVGQQRVPRRGRADHF